MTEVLRETEKGFQEKVIALARLQGWMAFHPYYSMRSTPGWPDLALAREVLIIAEIKTEKGRLTKMQRMWGERLSRCPGVEYYVWRPSMWDEIVERLTFRRALEREG